MQFSEFVYVPGKARPAGSVAALVKGTTIDGALRALHLAAKRHESAESVNLTWTVYQVIGISTNIQILMIGK